MMALIFDLDDTLLNSEKRIGKATRQALLDCHEAGYRLILATSRPIRAVRHFVERDILDLCLSITLNGAVAHKLALQGRPQMFGRLGPGTSTLLQRLDGLERDLHLSIEFEGTSFATNRIFSDRELREDHSATPDMVVPWHRIDPQMVSKIAVDGLGVSLDDCLAMKTDHPELNFIPAMDRTFVNIVPARVDKSTTLLKAAAEMGIDLGRSIAFGDDLPDLEMFGVVGRSVAMSNGKKPVTQAADEVIGHCDEDAIGAYLNEHVLG
jgi:HAD superfamily hydrolase (TIGR01484 family)